MDQTALQVTAPDDPGPRWPEGYVAVLCAAGAQEKAIPYCLGWVRRFFARFPGRHRRDLGRAEIETFLAETAAHPGIANWQVQQARDALELYYAKFRGIALEPRECGADSHTQSSGKPAPPAGAAPQAGTACPCGGLQNTAVPYPRPLASVKGEPVGNGSVGGPGGAAPLSGRGDESGVARDTACRAHSKTAARGDARPPVAEEGKGTCNWQVLEERLKDVLRTEHYAYATEQSYVAWVRRYVAFHGWRKPSTLEAEHVHAFLKHLAA